MHVIATLIFTSLSGLSRARHLSGGARENPLRNGSISKEVQSPVLQTVDWKDDDVQEIDAPVGPPSNRFKRQLAYGDVVTGVYDYLAPAPSALELDDFGNSIDVTLPGFEFRMTSSRSTLSTVTVTTVTPSTPQNNAITENNAVQSGDTKFTFLTPGSVYIPLSNGRNPCEYNSECYELREPDQWCPAHNLPSQTFERGCGCEHSVGYCLIERRNENRYEYTDCYSRTLSKC